MDLNKSMCVAVLALTLAACGGGSSTGSADAGGGTNSNPISGAGGSTTNVIATSGTLQTVATTAAYSSGSQQASFFSALNTIRAAAGAGVVDQSVQLDTSSQAHATYLTSNIVAAAAAGTSLHDEVSTLPNYYGDTYTSRIATAGFSANFATEVIGGTGASLNAADCANGLMDTVYHAAALLSQETYVGIGIGADAAGIPLCVSDLASASADAYGQVPASGALIAYPYNNQTGVLETFYVADESPRPSVTLFPNQTAGTPVVVRVRNADYVNAQAAGTLSVTVTQFQLKDSSGDEVPAAILAPTAIAAGSGVTLNADTNLGDGFVVLVPLAPLTRGQTYTATFSSTLKTGGPTLSKTWSFTTNP